jgi:hypothetical protein
VEASEVCALEERLAMPSTSETRETLALLLAADFREFGSSGRIFERASVLDALVAGARPTLKLEELRAEFVAKGAVLVTYVARSAAGPGWKPPSLHSSLWVRSENRWQLRFHQGTRLAEDDR